MKTGTAKQRYEALKTTREPFLTKARDCALLTIPALTPPEGHNGSSSLPTPFQGLGARGVNNLASKLLLALLPPNSPFFKLTIDDFALRELTQQEGKRALVEEALGSVERTVTNEIEATALRVTTFEGLKRLVNDGNVMLYLIPEGGMRLYRLDRYVVRRDPMGHVQEHVVCETMAPDMLPEGVAQAVQQEATKSNSSADKTVDLFTHVYRKGKKWVVYQQAGSVIVPGSVGSYPIDKSPWIPLRWTRVDGEDYGRGHVEEHFGDLRSLEALTQAIVEGAAAAARMLVLVNPNGSTDEDDVANAPNGSVKPGRADDVTVVQMEKFADFRVAFQTIEMLTERLSYAFLLNTAIQRNGERVTAEEIRYMAGELEDTLGGLYSIMSQEFQLPLVNRLMHQMERQRRLPALPDGVVRPAIVTGMEALGRGHDVNKLKAFAADLTSLLGPEQALRILNGPDLVKRLGTGYGIDMKGLVKSEEQIAQENQMAQMQALVQQLGPNAINQLGNVTKQAMANGQTAAS